MTTIDWTLPAPAKLNLMLHITGQREDGFHHLQTLFQLIDYGDRLEFKATTSTKASVDLLCDITHLSASDNLIVRAAQLLLPHSTQFYEVQITLDKCIPMGGGLGGGSSDAATALLALNQIWRCGFTKHQLARMAAPLGADIPVFVMGQSAWATGIGEQLTPVKIPTQWYVICHPNIAVSTARVFADPHLTRNSQETTIQSALAGLGRNDCEPVVRHNYPEIAAMLDTMNDFGQARLTGTGACGFIAVTHSTAASQVAQSLSSQYTTFVACGIDESPVHDQLRLLTHNSSNTD